MYLVMEKKVSFVYAVKTTVNGWIMFQTKQAFFAWLDANACGYFDFRICRVNVSVAEF